MTQTHPQIGRAALWMTGAIVSFSAMAVAGRALSPVHDTFEIMMYRSFFGLLVVVLLLTARRRWSEVSGQAIGLHLGRNVMHFIGQNLWFYAVPLVPLSLVFALEFTMPIWVILLSPLLLGERMTRVRVLAAVIGFIGVLIMARPTAQSVDAGTLAALGSALFFALTGILTKRLTRVASIACIMFWLTLLQAVMGLAAAGMDGDIAWPTAQSWPWLVLVGCAGLLAHFCLTNALAIAPATVVIPMDFVRLPAIAIVGMVLYAEPLDLWVLLGAVVIFGGNYFNIWSESRKKRVA